MGRPRKPRCPICQHTISDAENSKASALAHLLAECERAASQLVHACGAGWDTELRAAMAAFTETPEETTAP